MSRWVAVAQAKAIDRIFTISPLSGSANTTFFHVKTIAIFIYIKLQYVT